MQIRLAAPIAVSLTCVLAPPAMGAGIISDRPCYREGARATFLGQGFPPGQAVAISLDGQQIGTQAANPLGQVAGAIPALTPIPGSERARTLTMSQVANPALTTALVFKETTIDVVTTPRRFRPGTRFTIRARGFYSENNTPTTLWAHVRGPRKRTVRVGALTGPCGKVRATRKTIFRRGDRAGFYIVQFDTVRPYRGRNVPVGFRRAYTIRRIITFSRASSFSSPVFGGRSGWEPDA